MATNFENYTHQQLLSMLASADAETLRARGAQLADAAAAIKEIGESLKDHRVTGWEGESARAFQEWVNRAGNATLRLSEYSATGGKWLTEAGQVVVEVKANMPSYDASAAASFQAARMSHNDPDALQIGRQAALRLTSDHDRAVQQMTKLAQSYEASAASMEAAQVPTFPPLPDPFIPHNIDREQTWTRSGDVFTAAVASAGASRTPVSVGPSGSPYESASVSGPQPWPGGAATTPSGPRSGALWALSDRDVPMGLDSLGTLPDKTPPPTEIVSGGGGPGLGGARTTYGGAAPPQVRLPVDGLSKPAGPIVQGGSGPSGTTAGASVPPHDGGVSGGRPVTSRGLGARMPQGTVIGGEGAHAGGRGMGAGDGPTSGAGGSALGRRLATEPGGVVSARQPNAGRPIAGGQPFTQGGSGLVRGGGGQRGGRPDYLAEDEETWQSGRRVVPPVVD